MPPPAPLQHDHAICEKHGLGDGMGHEYHRHAMIEKEGLEMIVKELAGDSSRAAKGSSRSREPRFSHQGPRQGDTHLHATREFLGKTFHGRLSPTVWISRRAIA